MSAVQTMDAVLPLTARDARRARILLYSLDRFFRGLETCWIVTPEEELESIRESLPKVGLPLRILPETELVPELGSHWLPGSSKLGRPCLPGWTIQQLVKIGIASRVRSAFYLTLDADAFCVRPVHASDLVVDGRALATVAVDDGGPALEVEREWCQAAARVLRLPMPMRLFHGVTPAVLSQEGVLRLQEHLARHGRRPWGRRLVATWCRYLIQQRRQPWTEYALYGTFLQGAGLYDRYHVDGGPTTLCGNCVWEEADLATWDPARSFTGDGSFWFSVVQSYTGIPADDVWRLVGPYLVPGKATC